MKPVIYLDLDGVLVDFVRGAFKVHGRSINFEDVQWDFCSQLGFDGPNDPAFWQPMGFEYWRDLDWTDEGPWLLAMLEKEFGERIVILSSPADTPGCIDGKRAWIDKHIPQYRKRHFIGKPKHAVAGPGKILIDDHEGNTDPFVAAGGSAVLVPRPWNKRKNLTNGGAFDVAMVVAEALVPVEA